MKIKKSEVVIRKKGKVAIPSWSTDHEINFLKHMVSWRLLGGNPDYGINRTRSSAKTFLTRYRDAMRLRCRWCDIDRVVVAAALDEVERDLFAGKCVFVCAGADNVGCGSDPGMSLASLDYAVSKCVADKGDVIYLSAIED
jgi:hypothetical protein